ncbi:MAG TPA: type III PLP-dependent enzyme, partial [Candidatus Binatia bacterium]|nr:type III PLP-dependent enzyme [Candidatus Binatia bacterium]
MTPSPSALELAREKKLKTPFILLDEERIAANYRAVAEAFGPDIGIFFAVKANNHPLALHAIEKCGGNFDVASAAELSLLCDMGIEGSRVTFSNPVKVPDDVAYAHERGVRLFAFDSDDEIPKIAAFAPGAQLCVRLAVDNTGSGWPLSGKFGVNDDEAVRLLMKAKEAGLEPVGTTFHVGSQCENVRNWRSAVEHCAHVWKKAAAAGVKLSVLNLGGGLPAPYRQGLPTVAEIGGEATRAIRELLPEASRVMIEPGRFLVADAGVFVASVIGRAVRNGEKKIYLDAGVFNGLMETYETFWYPVQCLTKGAPAHKELVSLVGPSCDSIDVIVKDIELPALGVGDRV